MITVRLPSGLTRIAESGVDFEALPENIIFEAGQSEYILPIVGIYDEIEEGIEDLTLKMRFFSCGDTLEFSATAFITDSDPLGIVMGTDEYCKEFEGYATLFAEVSGGYGHVDYFWQRDSLGGEATDPSDFLNPNPTDDPNLYSYNWLTVRDECGLSLDSEIAFYLENKCPIVAPNVFTPNNDGLNDTFEILNLELFPGSQLIVYNRWGQVVYEDNNYKNDWEAEELKEGVYYWVVTLSQPSEESVVNGYVHIIKNE